MITVTVAARTKKIPVGEAWNMLTDIEKYPQRVKYVKKVRANEIGEGTIWYDTTTILLVPLKLSHTITDFKKNSKYCFNVHLPFGGTMVQEYQLLKEGAGGTRIVGSIKYDLGVKVLNRTIGRVLEGRLRNMLLSSILSLGCEAIN